MTPAARVSSQTVDARPERIVVVGSGAIACGLAAVATRAGDVILLARSEQAAQRARERIGQPLGTGSLSVSTRVEDLAGADIVIEAVAEDLSVKVEVLRAADAATSRSALLATTTSSLSIEVLAQSCDAAERFAGLHVFNPVRRMDLVEVAFPERASAATRARALGLCERLGKQAVLVPDVPGFVVNRLLFPLLFAAVDLMHESGMPAADVDRCMTLGAGHPMGPLALLDFVGLDIAAAIGSEIGTPAPPPLLALVADGALGRKAGRGFHSYETEPTA